MTDKAEKLFFFLKNHPNERYEKRYLVEKLDIRMQSLSPIIKNFVNHGLITEDIEKDKNGIVKRYIQITERGEHFDPIEEERKEQEAKINAIGDRKRQKAIENGEIPVFFTSKE